MYHSKSESEGEEITREEGGGIDLFGDTNEWGGEEGGDEVEGGGFLPDSDEEMDQMIEGMIQRAQPGGSPIRKMVVFFTFFSYPLRVGSLLTILFFFLFFKSHKGITKATT